jgi:hypothetical protein
MRLSSWTSLRRDDKEHYPYLSLWVLLRMDVLLVLLPLEVWKDGIIWAEKKTASPTKRLFTLSTFIRESYPYAWVGSYMNSSVSSPYVEVLSYRSTLLLHFSHRSYPFSCLGGRGSGFLSFISSFSNNYTIYLPISTFQNLTDCLHYTYIECPIFRE